MSIERSNVFAKSGTNKRLYAVNDNVVSDAYRKGTTETEEKYLTATREAIATIYEALAVLAEKTDVLIEHRAIDEVTKSGIITSIITERGKNNLHCGFGTKFTESETQLRNDIDAGGKALNDALDLLMKTTGYDPFTMG